jgi:hypothetical protein
MRPLWAAFSVPALTAGKNYRSSVVKLRKSSGLRAAKYGLDFKKKGSLVLAAVGG